MWMEFRRGERSLSHVEIKYTNKLRHFGKNTMHSKSKYKPHEHRYFSL